MASPWPLASSDSATTPPVFSPFFGQDATAFALSSQGGFLRSTDGGVSWSQSNFGLDRRLWGYELGVLVTR